MGGGDLGSVWASVGLKTGPLAGDIGKVQGMMSGLDKKMTSQAASMSGAGRRIGSAFAGAAKLIGVAAIGVGVASVKLAVDFDTAIRKAGSVAEASGVQMKQWGDKILEMSKKFPESAEQMANALYWIKSDMPTATEAQQWDTLNIALEGSVAGVADLSDTTEALITAQNAYNEMQPAKYMDIMNASVQRGSITLQDFVANQGKATGTAAQVGVKFNELAAAAATLTRKGVPVETAFMALNQTMMAFIKPQEDATKAAAELGFDLSATGLHAMGLGGAMTKLNSLLSEDAIASGGAAATMADLFPNLRALKAVMPLAGVSAADFAEDLAKIPDAATGVSERMAAINLEGLEMKFKIMMNNIKAPMIELGLKIFPYLEKGIAAVTRIMEGKNEAFNSFAKSMQTAGAALWDIGKAVVSIKPLLYGLGAAFAAIKITNLVTGLKGLKGIASLGGLFKTTGSSVGVLGNAIANLQLGLGGVVPIAGFAASLASIGIVAAPVAAAIGLFAYKTWESDRAATAAWDDIRKMDKSMGDAAKNALPLVQKLDSLRKSLEGMDPSGQAYKDRLEQIKQLQNEIAGIYPGLISGIDGEGNALIGVTKELEKQLRLRMALAGIHPSGKGAAVSIEYPAVEKEKTIKAMDTVEEKTEELRNYLSKNTKMSADDIQMATSQMITSWEAGNRALDDFGKNAEASGFYFKDTATLEGYKRIIDQIKVAWKEAGGSWDAFTSRVGVQSQEFAVAVEDMKAKANEAGVAATALPQQVVDALSSTNKASRQAGVDALAIYAAGLSTGKPEVAAQVQGIVGTLQTELAKGSKASQTVVDNLMAELRTILGIPLPPIPITVEDKATAEAKRIKDYLDNLAATTIIFSLLGQPGHPSNFVPMEPEGIGKWMASGIESGFNAKKPNLQASVQSGGGGMFDDMVANVQKANDAMNALTAGTTTWGAMNLEMVNKEFSDMETAIYGVSRNLAGLNDAAGGAALGAWRNLRGALDSANASLKATEAELASSDEKIMRWERSLELVNRKIDAGIEASQKLVTGYQDAISELSQMKIRGETVADNASFKLQQKSASLQLQIMKAEDKHDYALVASLTRQKEKVDRQKEEKDLQTSITYGPQRRQIEQATDALYGHESTLKKILAGIRKNQNGIEIETKRQRALNKLNDELEKKITEERDRVWEMKVQYDQTIKTVQTLQGAIDEMGRNAVARWNEIEQAAKDAWKAANPEAEGEAPAGSYQHGGFVGVGGGRVEYGEFVLSKAMLKALGQQRSPRYQPVQTPTQSSMDINVPVYLDSRMIGRAVAKVTGKTASAYAKSGGRY